MNDLEKEVMWNKAGGPTQTGKRYCINFVCLDLKEESQ